MFFWVIADDLVVVGEVSRELAFESRALLGAQLTAALVFGTSQIWLQPAELVF